MDLIDLLLMLRKERDRRAAGGKTTFEELVAESRRLLKSGTALRYGGGPGCDRGDALVYAYKGGEVVDRLNIKCGFDHYVFALHLAMAVMSVMRTHCRPKIYYPMGLTGNPVRRTPQEIEFDASQDPSNNWSSKVAPMSGSYVWGSGHLKLSRPDARSTAGQMVWDLIVL